MPSDSQQPHDPPSKNLPAAGQPAGLGSPAAEPAPRRKIGRRGVVQEKTTPGAWERFRETFRKYPLWFSTIAGVALLLIVWGISRPASSKPLFEQAEFGLEVRSNKQLENVTSMLGHLEDFQFQDISSTLVERLNQWSQRRKDVKDNWQPDPLVVETIQNQALPPQLLAYYGNIDSLQFLREDGFQLQEAVWCRNIGNGLGRHGLDDLVLAQAMFDWTMRNIQLEDSSEEKVVDSTPSSILLGRGEPQTRAWIFMLLARQQGLNVVMLGYPDPARPEVIKPWIPALMHNGELYLFDHNLGLPIPGPEGVPVATLKQVAADDGLLRQLDISTSQIRYPVEAKDIQKVIAFVEASPQFVSRRMHRLEDQLAGDDQLVLTVKPSELARELNTFDHVGETRIWHYPLVCLENTRRLFDPQFQQALNPQDRQAQDALRRRLSEELEIFTLPGIVETGRRNLDIDPPFIQEMRKKAEEESGIPPQQAKPLPPRIAGVLWKGRMLQFRDAGVAKTQVPEDLGKLDETARGVQLATSHAHGVDRTAATYLQYGRPVNRHIDTWEKQFREEQRRGLNIDADQVLNRIRTGKRTATVWLGSLAFEREDYLTAVEYFRDQILEERPDGPWSRAARYNLARSLEALGQQAESQGDILAAIDSYQQAFDIYDQETTSQRHGNLLRAKQLRERLSALSSSDRLKSERAPSTPPTTNEDGPAPSEPPTAN